MLVYQKLPLYILWHLMSFNCWESGDGADMQRQTIRPKENMKQNKQHTHTKKTSINIL